MNLIAQRPNYWNSVVGQDRALKVLQSMLRTQRFLLRGFIFQGPFGVGKTTTAYIHARALMCTGNDPLGCGQCPSCRLIDEQGIDNHPDFMEVDAASKSGVADAREILTQLDALPVLGARRVAMIDEAHRLSREAWDVYLKPLEAGKINSNVIFVSSDGDSIKIGIQQRSCRIRFTLVKTELILGLLVKLATENEIAYELDALRLIAEAGKGSPRAAVKLLDTTAAQGAVTLELAQNAIDTTLEDTCIEVLKAVVASDQVKSVELIDELSRGYNPAKIVEALFAQFGHAIFSEGMDAIRNGFPDIPSTTALFIKWASTPFIPSDALPLLVYELICVRDPKTAKALPPASIYAPRPQLSLKPHTLQPRELIAILGGTVDR